MLLIILWTVVLSAAVVLYFRQTYSRFSRHGVKTFRPLPFVGNMGKVLLKVDHLVDDLICLYNSFPEERFVGRYEFEQPSVVIRDLELIKQITIKDFESFLDHRVIIDTDLDPFFGRNLFSMKGQEWKDMRSTLSPAFTSSKMRYMVPFMVEVGDQMIKSLKKNIIESGDKYLDVDCKDLTTRYSNDVIASCAFGLKVDSQVEQNNQFYQRGKEASTFKFKQLMMFIMMASCPRLVTWLKWSFFPKPTQDYFRKLVISTMENREEQHIIRPDMIHLLMEVKKGRLTHEDKIKDEDAGFATVEESAVGKKVIKKDWSNDDLIAQAVIFFIAGFDTVSIGMCFTLFELARNPEVQEKLVQEIKENDAITGGKFDYTSIQNLRYLDMIVSETFRLWPPAIFLDRRCNKDYNLGKPNDKADEDFIVRKGEGVIIPVIALHRDPHYFPNPDTFDPERFSDDNKHKIHTSSYLPFGIGPRNCIGSRFALCEIKVMVYQVIRSMEVSISKKTLLPPTLTKDGFSPTLKGGHWLRFSIRED